MRIATERLPMHSQHLQSTRPADPHPRETFQRHYSTVWKRRWVVVAVALATWLVVGLGTFLPPARFDASALIQIDWGKINLVQDVVIDDRREESGNLYLTQESILRSRALARRVVEELRPWEHPLFRSRSAGQEVVDFDLVKESTRAVQSMARITHIRNTQLIEVGFVTPDAQLSADLANALVRQYVLFNAEAESDLARGASSFIGEQIEELRREIQTKERLLLERAQRGEGTLDARNEEILFQRLEDLNRGLTAAEAERVAAEAHYTNVRNTASGSLPQVRDLPSVRELRTKQAALKEEYRRLSSRFGPHWPERKRMEESLEEAKRSLDEEIRAESARVRSLARAEYQEAVAKENLLRLSVAEEKGKVEGLQHTAASHAQLRAELDSQREMLSGLLRRRGETDLSADLGERQPVKVRVVEAAEAPERASSPNLFMNLFVGLFLGVGLGIGLAFLLDYFDDRIATVEDLKHQVPLPYLGIVPRCESLPLVPGARQLPSGTTSAARRSLPAEDRSPGPSDAVVDERLRFLRGSLLLSNPGKAPKIVLITSPDQNCGKTFLSCSLSAALVELGKTVLLIDSDLRNPNLHKVFRYRNRVGLTNVLTGQRALHDGCVMRTHTANLFLLMAGPASPNPGELLASSAMSDVLETAARHFDFVLLDSAPLLPVFDTHILSVRSDSVLLVARAGETSRQSVRTSIELVERVNGKITGVVLNDVDLSDYPYQGSYAYEYRATSFRSRYQPAKTAQNSQI